MDFHGSRSGSPSPLQAVSPERVNQQQGNVLSFDSSVASVTDKISQFNTLAMQSKQLERKTADAALKRAMLGREEAETEMRRYREEVRQLRKQVDEGRHREQRVSERLETVMEKYGRAKETHAHTQALWEKEIRRARKETFKCQSAIVKLQEELKASRASIRTSDEALAHEKERSKAREQEAFQARYELVGCQEELEQTLQKVKILEQERDAFRSLAKSEEDVARIASEGRLPLPPPDPEEAEEEKEDNHSSDRDSDSDRDSMNEDEADGLLAVPKQRASTRKSLNPRVSSATLLDVKSSAASEAEIGELTRLWLWEKQRADRSSELVEYLEAECHLRACSCMKKRPRASILDSARKRPNLEIGGGGGDRIILSEKATIASPAAKIRANMLPTAKMLQQSNMNISHSPEGRLDDNEEDLQEQNQQGLEKSPKQKGPRLSTIFIPEEGVFRTVSQQIAEEMEEAVAAAAVATVAAMPKEPCDEVPEVELAAVPTPTPAATAVVATQLAAFPQHDILDEDIQDADTTLGDVTTDTAEYTVETTTEQSMYARTPSVDPPSFAQQRTSLLSLLDAPHRQEAEQPINFYVPTTPGPAAPSATRDITVVREPDACVDVSMDDAADQAAPRAAASILVASTSMRDVDTEMDDTPTIHDEVEVGAEEEREESRVSDVTEVNCARGSQSSQGRPRSAQESVARNNDEVDNDNDQDATPQVQPQRYETPIMDEAPDTCSVRPHTVAAAGLFSLKTTTTKVPLREETTDPSLAQRIMAAQRTPTNKILPSASSSSAMYSDENTNTAGGNSENGDGPSFDINNPAMTPTMSREQCLAQIRERRGRARSAAGGSSSSSSTPSSGAATTIAAGTATTTRRPVTPGKERREVSAPVRRVASARRVRS